MIPPGWRPAETTDGEWLAAAAECSLTGSDLRAAFPELDWTEVLHPAYRVAADGGSTEVSWREVGRAAGREPRPGVHFDRLVGLPIRAFENGIDDAWAAWTAPPAQGSLPSGLSAVLLRVLQRETACSRGSVGVWGGWSVIAPAKARSATWLKAFGRDYLLFSSSVHAMASSIGDEDYQSANIWYPADKSWLLVTDIDHWSTFVGGSTPLADRLRSAKDLETRSV